MRRNSTMDSYSALPFVFPARTLELRMLLPTRASREIWMPLTSKPRDSAILARNRSVAIGTPCKMELPMTTKADALGRRHHAGRSGRSR